MKLPHGDQAIVDLAKLRDYCLNSSHPRGRHKARVFATTLGLGPADADWLRSALLEAAARVDVTERGTDEFGERFNIDFEVERDGRRAIIRSAWMVRIGEIVPRLLTCYVA